MHLAGLLFYGFSYFIMIISITDIACGKFLREDARKMEEENDEFEDDAHPPSSSLAECFRFDPVFSATPVRRAFDAEAERRARKLKYNDVFEVELPNDRKGNSNWCRCKDTNGVKQCGNRSRPRSSYCCMEACQYQSISARKLTAKCGQLQCITCHPDFNQMALDRTAVAAYARLLAQTGRNLVSKENYNNKELRFAAYRNVALWIFGKLGRKERRVLPSCVVKAIRKAFPKEAGERYTGYHVSIRERFSSDESGIDDVSDNEIDV